MSRKLETVKLWQDTVKLVREIAQATGVTMVKATHEAVSREYERLKRKGVIGKDDQDE